MATPATPNAPAAPMAPTEDRAAEDARWYELRGVRIARLAAVASLLGLVLILIAPIVIYFTLSVSLPLVGSTRGTARLTITLLEELLGLVVAGAFLTLISMVLYTLSFNALRKAARGFGGPFVLSIIGLLGMLLVALGVLLVIVTVFQAVGCAASGAASSCLSTSDLATGLYAALGGLFLAFLGWIGLLIGIFRIGSRFHSTLTMVGAILYIIPFLSVIAPLLVLVGIHGIVRRLETTGSA